MDDFWARVEPDWPAGEPVLHWHILAGEHPGVAALAEAYRGLTARPGLDRVPPEWLHQTLYLIGPAARLSEAEVRLMVGQVRAAARLWAPMRLSYGPAVLTGHSVCLRVSPAEPAAQLHGAVVTAAAAVLGDRAAAPPGVPYWGHLALAYASATVADGPLHRWLAAHPVEPITIMAAVIHLVSQTHRDHTFTWTPVATVPLGPRPAEAG